MNASWKINIGAAAETDNAVTITGLKTILHCLFDMEQTIRRAIKPGNLHNPKLSCQHADEVACKFEDECQYVHYLCSLYPDAALKNFSLTIVARCDLACGGNTVHMNIEAMFRKILIRVWRGLYPGPEHHRASTSSIATTFSIRRADNQPSPCRRHALRGRGKNKTPEKAVRMRAQNEKNFQLKTAQSDHNHEQRYP